MNISFHHLDLQLAQPWVISRGKTDVARVVVVQLMDRDGVIGLGEAAPISRYQESVKSVESFLQKIDPAQLSPDSIPGSMAYLDTLHAGEMAAKCSVNIALLDLAAKRAQKSLCDFLGLGFREKHHATSFTIGLGSLAVTREKALAARDYPVLKMKAGGTKDQAALRALREVAPEKKIRVDANEAWHSREEALKNIEWLAQDPQVEFVEQPLPAATASKDWMWLKQRSPLPIFADESHHLAADTAHAAECFHGVNIKLVKSAGVTGGLEALKAARQAGLKTMLGCMIETSILISAAAHLAELCDYLDLDGNLLITNDPYLGVAAKNGILSFASAPEKYGLRVCAKEGQRASLA
ncbi:MAG TPA: dipeptide epimerase [Verrucomicrobiae bacterium]|nr:dipeptide epimerase [Verrucomicrobiae bacterium]